jgi:hypothetical protein
LKDQNKIPEQIDQVSALMRHKLGGRGRDLGAVLRKTGHRLPRSLRKQAATLAEARAMAEHPKLRMTMDTQTLSRATRDVNAHLEAIDLKDQRKGWWLGMAGGLVFNLLLAFVLLILFLRWQGLV